MRLKVVFTIFLALGTICTMGQKKLLYQASGEIIQKGEKAFLKREYQNAVNYFNKINPGDTNYRIAQTKLASSYYELKNHPKTLAIMEQIQAQSGTLMAEDFITLGSTYQATGNTEAALESFNLGISQYPMNPLLFYSRGVLFQELKQDQKAIQNFQETLKRNIFHAPSHLKLAEYAKTKGELAKAMMANNLYLIFAPSGVTETLIQYNDFLRAPTPGKKVNWSTSTEDFSSIDEKIASLGALNKKFKTPNKLDLPIVKQNYLLFTEIQKLPVEDGFWNSFYIPFYLEILNDKKFNVFMYYMLRNIQTKEVTNAIRQSLSQVNEFPNYAGTLWQQEHKVQKSMFDGKLQKVYYFWGNNQSVSGRGIFVDNEPVGKFEYYHSSGNLSALGNYSEDGEQDGTWTYFYKNGNISEKKTLEDGDPIGTDSLFYDYNQLKSTQKHQEDGNLLVTTYFVTGKVKSVTNYRDGSLNGLGTFYTSTGQLDYKTHFVNDQPNGLYSSYFDIGQLRDSLFFDNGLKSGKAYEFYRNGNKKSEYNYNNGELNGLAWEWFYNGTVQVEAHFENGSFTGTRKEYYPNGRLMLESDFENKNSKITYYSEYDEDGILNLKLTYKNSELISYEVFNKQGETIEAQQKLGDVFEYKSFYTNEAPMSQGKYSTLNGGKIEDWKEYNKNGVLVSTTPHTNGKIDGNQIDYYTSGETLRVTPYSNNLFNGLYKEFYANGKLYEQGYYINGIAEGKWVSYYKNGTVSTESFFVSGKLSGTQKHFAVNSKLDFAKTYRDDILLSYAAYDTNESVIHTSQITNNTHEYEFRYPNGELLRKFHFSGNTFHGESISYYPSGQIMSQGNYSNQNLEGIWSWYHPNGQLKKKGEYSAGLKTGEWKIYYPTGQLKSEETFENGIKEGVYHQYYKNGNLEIELTYSSGKKHGLGKYYNSMGDLQQVRTYEHGIWTSYSYTGKDGNLVPAIPVEKETIQCISYFSNGNKSKEFGMVNGNFEGVYLDYYSNGQIQSQTTFKANMIVDTIKSYYENGTIESEIPYVDYEKQGIAKYYDTTGVLTRSEMYLMDSLHGKSIIYQNGKPTKTQVYYNNDLISK